MVWKKDTRGGIIQLKSKAFLSCKCFHGLNSTLHSFHKEGSEGLPFDLSHARFHPVIRDGVVDARFKNFLEVVDMSIIKILIDCIWPLGSQGTDIADDYPFVG